jgi:uncharacterized protein YjiS (DUF1127 family)
MISHYLNLERLIPSTSRHQNSLAALPRRVVFNWKSWLRNRRELRNLDKDQLYDVGLSQTTVEQACKLNLLRR